MKNREEKSVSVYEKCPVYESENFVLRLVCTDDAADLLACYKHPTVSVAANGAGCNYGYGSQTAAEMRAFIARWLEEYQNRWFVRFSIVDKQTNKAVGTVEVMDSGILPVHLMLDLEARYENEECLSELIAVFDSFFVDFKCAQIIIVTTPEADCRLKALTEKGYAPYPKCDAWPYENCYIKRR